MNKQELIEAIIELPVDCSGSRPKIDKLTTLELIKLLDEPQKPVVPPVVSVWYQINKDNLYKNISYLCANWVKSTTDDTLFNWMSNTDNFIEILINMHRFGYEVEKEKRYLVTLKNGQPLVKSQSWSTLYFSQDVTAGNYKVTRKELEDAGFGWVFDSPGVEVEEVE